MVAHTRIFCKCIFALVLWGRRCSLVKKAGATNNDHGKVPASKIAGKYQYGFSLPCTFVVYLKMCSFKK